MRGCLPALMAALVMGMCQAEPSTLPVQDDALGPALLTASGNGDFNEVELLLNQGAPIEARDFLNRTPLFLACFAHPEVVKLLLAHGARVDPIAKNGDTTLGIACEYDQLATAKILLAAGADFTRTNQWGRTPLMLAAREGHDDIVSLLISNHVDVNYCASDNPALFYAVWKDHLSTAKLLLEAGAAVTRSPTTPQSVTNPPTILSLAAETGDFSLLDLLLAHGAQVNERNVLGISALLQVAISGKQPEILGYFLEKGADPNLADNTGQTPFMAVVDNQNIPTLRFFLQHGANPEARDKEGRTALIRAARIGAEAQVQELILQKADVNAVDNRGESALTYTADRGDTRLVNSLKAAGANPAPLHIIAKETENPPLPANHRWALAVGALYAQWNGASHEKLYEEESEALSRRSLERQWEIKDRVGLIRMVRRLELGPTLIPTIYEQLQDSLAQAGAERKLLRALQLVFLDASWREKTNVAWDLCRAANLVRFGVNAGYLPENEAWPLLMPIARKTQATFGSWREMSDNFLDSREIDADEESGNLRACARLLLNPKDSNSPWNQLPWQTDLSAN